MSQETQACAVRCTGTLYLLSHIRNSVVVIITLQLHDFPPSHLSNCNSSMSPQGDSFRPQNTVIIMFSVYWICACLCRHREDVYVFFSFCLITLDDVVSTVFFVAEFLGTLLLLLCCRLNRSSSLCCLDTKLTAAYSNSAEKTKRRHTAIQMSMALT